MAKQIESCEILNPPAKIGIIGGGQLGRMLSFEAKRMGYYVIVLDPTPDCPASQVSDSQIVASLYDCEAIRQLAGKADVITYEFEHINADVLCKLSNEGFKIRPSGFTLKKIQDKFLQKTLFQNNGLPVPKFIKACDLNAAKEASKHLGFPMLFKSCTGGYDGKGNALVRNEEELASSFARLYTGKNDIMAEEFVNFEKEISVIAAKGGSKTVSVYPIVENVHKDNILRLTKAPANVSEATFEKVQSIAEKVVNIFNDIGVFCIELFLTREGEVLINEVAPRTHNSGHYTIEACITSQFEQHIRAITGMPLGSSRMIKSAAMVNILGNKTISDGYIVSGLEHILEFEEVYFHYYGKNFVDINKKIGHITALAETVAEAEKKAAAALKMLDIKCCLS